MGSTDAGSDEALGPEGSGLRTLPPVGNGLFCEAESVCEDEPALRVDAKEASALGGRGEVACTRARATGVATIESAAAWTHGGGAGGKLANRRRCFSVSFLKRYFNLSILRGGAAGLVSGASVSASLRFLFTLAALTLTDGRAGSGAGEAAADAAVGGRWVLVRLSTEMLLPGSSSGAGRGAVTAGTGRGLATLDVE